jgi:HEAT repeat protein
MTKPDDLRNRQGFLIALARLFQAAGPPRETGWSAFEAQFSDRRKADMPSRTQYYQWRSGKQLPRADKAGIFTDLVVWLHQRAAKNGDQSSPSPSQWQGALRYLHQDEPKATDRSPAHSSLDKSRIALASWCAAEGQRHVDALARLPYLEGHPDPTGHNISAHTRIGIRQPSAGDLPVTDAYRLAADPSDPRGAVEELPYDDAVTRYRQLVIVGDAGAGKTWLLHHHAIAVARAADMALTTTGTPLNRIALPLLVRADTLAAAHRPGRGLAETVVDALALSGSRIPKGLRSPLISHIRGGPVIYLIDALDETTTDHHTALNAILTPPDNTHTHTRYIATSRLTGYTTVFNPAERTEAELLPFTDPQTYIDSWHLPPERHDNLLQRLDTHPGIAQMARIPLLLAFLCHLANDRNEALPDSRAHLYERIIRRFLTAEHHHTKLNPQRPQPNPLSPDPQTRADEYLALLRPLAYTIATRPEGWNDTITRETLLEHLKNIDRPHDLTAAETLTLLTDDTGILTPAGPTSASRTPPIRFIHRTFVEYLVAAHMTARVNRVDRCLDSFLDLDNNWRQVWVLAISIAPTVLLPKIIDRKRDPVHIGLSIAGDAIAEFDSAARNALSDLVDSLALKWSALAYRNEADRCVRVNAISALGRLGGGLALDTLRRLMVVENSELLYETTSALRKSTDARAADLLAELFADPTLGRAIRQRVADALGDIGSPIAIEALRAVAFDRTDDQFIRRCAVGGLGRGGDHDSVDKLLTLMKDETEERDLCLAAAYALSALSEPASTNSLHQFILSADQPKEAFPMFGGNLRGVAVGALAIIGTPMAVGLLRELIEDPNNDPNLRQTAASSLARAKSPTAQAAINDLLATDDIDVRRLAARGLYMLGARPSSASLQSMLADSDLSVSVRQGAINMLKQRGERSAVVLMRDLLVEADTDPALRRSVAEAVCQLDASACTDTWRDLLNDKNADLALRRVAACALALAGSLEGLGILREVLSDLNAPRMVWDTAVSTFASSADAAALDTLIELATNTGTQTFLRWRAVDALAVFKSFRTTQTLAQLLFDEDTDVAERAAVALGTVGGQPAMTALDEALNGSRSSAAKYKAIQSITRLDGPSAVEVLIQAINNTDSRSALRSEALEALERIDHDGLCRWLISNFDLACRNEKLRRVLYLLFQDRPCPPQLRFRTAEALALVTAAAVGEEQN